MKKLALKLLKFYQKYLSIDQGWLHWVFPYKKSCIYFPTCSQYTYEAINKKGLFKGTFLGFKRILRCNPFFKGGYDPVK